MAPHSSLARLQQANLFVVMAGALAWATWHWGDSPVRALLGAVLIAFNFTILLGLQGITLSIVSRGDSAPRPRAGELLRAWWCEAVQFTRVFYWRQPFRWRRFPDRLEPAARGRRGFVFIHGFLCNRGFWSPWLEQLQGEGDTYVAVNLEPVFTSIDAYAPIVDDAVRRVTAATGLPPVLVCHSMGGLAARAWLRAAGDSSRVHKVVTIGSPHGGAWIARVSHTPNGRQMRLASSWLQQLQRDEARHTLPAFTCWYSHCDNIVFPASTATLPGADNRLVRGPAHVELGFHPDVVASTLALADAR